MTSKVCPMNVQNGAFLTVFWSEDAERRFLNGQNRSDHVGLRESVKKSDIPCILGIIYIIYIFFISRHARDLVPYMRYRPW